MIEPQNTLMPIAGPVSSVETTHGDVTFGEMLAQSLSMIPQFGHGSPDAVSADAVSADDGDLQQSDEPEAGSSTDRGRARSRAPGGSPELFAGVAPTRRFAIPRPVEGQPVAPGPVIVGEPGQPTKPGTPEVPQPPVLRSDGGDTELSPTNIAPQLTAMEGVTGSPDGVAPVAGNVEPSRNGDQRPSAVAEPQLLESAAAELDTLYPVDGGVFEQMPLAVDNDTGSVRSEGSAMPQPSSAAPVVDAEGAGQPAAPVGPRLESHQGPASGAVPPMSQPPDAVSIEDAAVVLGEARAVSLGEKATERDSAVTTSGRDTASLPASPESVSRGSAPVGTFTSPAAPVQHTALAERVMEAVQLQANQPPPRTMIVDIPEIEGLRLVVSVRSGGEVHVVPTSSSSVSPGYQPFLSELEGVLAERGFVMTGDGRRRGANQYQRDDNDVPRRSQPTFRRAPDNELRI